MKKYLLACTALTLIAGAASAGGIQRTGDRSQILFEKGENYLEFSVSSVHPKVSGSLFGGVLTSGNIQKDYRTFEIGYKREINDKLTLAIYANEPVGADVDYTAANVYPFAGSNAEVESLAVTGLLKYQFTDRVSAYGGPRIQSLSGNVTILTAGLPLPPAYTLNVDKDYKAGFVLGAAYQIPEIALKVALTYESEIEHDFNDNTGTEFKVKIPQAVTLHAQSGVAKDTIVFGSIRWQEWTEFEIRPMDFVGGLVPIASEPSDIWTYELGVGRRFSEHWSGALTLGYEEDLGDIVGNLSGKDGFISYGVAAKYQTEAWDLTAGVRYIDIGSATTSIGAQFADNDAIAAGLKLGFRF
ncbi:Long-chain fatty acid transport protein [Roseovarius azorensis]|uniref:Long-chain fatty acid transport protein n=1 Tax=Roseovarius azorensis TaxID=1287727 RepID=A0A1H7VD93_9RHOB|nr:outer membrane protein transport protein [Roseovarius azorensis]SEM07232.1 Long-chain fatty acid transport protein [Roseovarius azorensis]